MLFLAALPGLGQDLRRLEARRLHGLAVQHLHTHPQRALAYGRQALAVAGQARDTAEQARATLSIGSAYFQLSRYDHALAADLDALRLGRKTGNWRIESNCYHNIGNIHLYRDQYAKAVGCFEQSRQIDLAHGDRAGAAATLHSIATAYSYFDEPKALATYGQALDHARRVRDSLSQSVTLNNIGHLHLSRREYDQALRYFAKCLHLNRLRSDTEGVATNLENIGNAYRGKRQYGQAIDCLRRSLSLSGNFASLRLDNHRYLAELYDTTGDHRQALAHFRQYIALRDSAFNRESTARLNELQTRFETAEKQIEKQRAELARKNTLAYASAAVAGLVLVLGGVLYNRYRLKTKANLLLAAANTEIRQSVAEKEVLLREIHHRVKNNLQLVSSLLTWQGSQITDPRMLTLIEENKGRIRSMAQIHESLYRSENLSHVNAQTYLGGVLDSLGQSYRCEREVALETCLQPVSLLADEAIPRGLIVNELVSNAFKHAFTGRPAGKITVAFAERDRQYELVVSDDGAGMPPPDARPASLGLSLVRMLTRQLAGRLETDTRHGTTFRITFPPPQPQATHPEYA